MNIAAAQHTNSECFISCSPFAVIFGWTAAWSPHPTRFSLGGAIAAA
jgi:hypothetical protein